jgi:cytoskeletal protein RodZ
VTAEVRSDRRDVLTSVGDQLRAERERRRITLAEVAGATKIRRSYLVALERDDWKILPAAVFARGFLRSYAEHLGLDSEHLLRVHQRQQRLARAADPSVAREESGARGLLEQIARARGVDTRSSWRWLIWNGLALAGIGVAVAVVWTLQARPAPIPADGPAAAARSSSPAVSTIGDAPVVQGGRTEPPPVAALVIPAATKKATGPEESLKPPAVADSVAEPETPVPVPKPSHLTVPEFGIGTEVAGPTLAVGPHRFEEGSVLRFRASVRGGRPGDTIRHVWLHGDRPVAVAPLDLYGETWSTESRLQLLPGSIGDWTVELRDTAGRVLARVRFSCFATVGVSSGPLSPSGTRRYGQETARLFCMFRQTPDAFVPFRSFDSLSVPQLPSMPSPLVPTIRKNKLPDGTPFQT